MGRSQHIPRASEPDRVPADDTGCTVLHVDMDAFFVSVELRERPDLRGKPVVVGGIGNRGVVSSASYEARSYGVRSAMPTSQARRLCPHAVFLPPDHGAYAEVSKAVMATFREVTPLVEPLSLDEAFLDVAGAIRRLGRPAEIGALLRRRVAAEQQITCSVGVASTKFVAKLASTRCKPDGMQVVPADGVLDYLHPLPVAALWGVGERTAEHLRRLGLFTVGDLARMPEKDLRRSVGQAVGAHLHALAWGRDPRHVTPNEPDRSISAEETFDRDVDDPAVIKRELLRLSERTAERLRRSGTVARTVSIKVRFADFRTLTRSRTLSEPTDTAGQLYATARALYEALGAERARVRLVGVRAEGLRGEDSEQLELGAPERGWREAERAVDLATRRFGSGTVRRGTLVSSTQPPSAVEGGASARYAPNEPPGGGQTGRTGHDVPPASPGGSSV